MAKGLVQLLSDIINLVLSGGKRTTADNVRTILNEIAQSNLNVVDGGLVVQKETGYSIPIIPSSDYSFAPKKYVDDAISNKIYDAIILRSTGPLAHRFSITVDDTGTLNAIDLGV